MTATATRPVETEPSAGPEQQGPRRRWNVPVRFAVPAVLLVWIVLSYALNGVQTLVMGREDTTAFHRWLNSINDKIIVNRGNNWFMHYVIGAINDSLNWIVTTLQNLISQPSYGRPVPVIGWAGVLALFVLIALAAAGVRSAILVGVFTFAFGLFGYWDESLDTLIITVVAVAICVLVGIPTGIWMSRSRAATATITPVLDVMQTMPSFAYLAPLALIFSIGAPAAVACTFIYSVPPLIRITAHGLRTVSETSVESSRSLGITRGQLLRKVQLPMAKRTIVVGLNQCMLAALSMATIAALISGPGLGPVVVQALQSLDIGTASVAGGLIVLIAIMLDRSTTAASERGELLRRSGDLNRRRRRAMLLAAAIITVGIVYLSHIRLGLAQFPSTQVGPKTARAIGNSVDTLVSHIDTFTLWLTNFVSDWVINPLQSLLAESPWWVTAAAILSLGTILGGRRALVSTAICLGIILGTGLWYDSMVTLTSTLVAAFAVIAVAIVLGVWMGRSRTADTVVRPVLDALQTIPPFVYLVPALALFGPTRFTAIVAAFLYGLPIASKLVADGIRGVSVTTVEAAESSGTTSWQMITKVQLPMARGGVVLAANQGLLYVLSMVVIGGLVGGGGLGYLVVAGFSQGELFGKGLAAGIAITALGVMLDRIFQNAAARHGRA